MANELNNTKEMHTSGYALMLFLGGGGFSSAVEHLSYLATYEVLSLIASTTYPHKTHNEILFELLLTIIENTIKCVDVGKLKSSYTAGGNIKLFSYFGK